MLFNSSAFLLAFLPLTVLAYYAVSGFGRPVQTLVLAVASIFYYAYWRIDFLWVLLISIVGNYLAYQLILRTRSKWQTALGIAANLLFLGYFKYTYFVVEQIDALFGAGLTIDKIVLPIGISFFTFQQIALLADAYSGKAAPMKPVPFTLFVSFFPQLIAGPIVHHSEIMPQLVGKTARLFSSRYAAVGLSVFTVGLVKKVLIADPLGAAAQPFFALAASGVSLSFIEAWSGALAYTFQLYFDFSGYSDMAIGLALLFGIRLPLNFFSPYKSLDIIDFWRRWHMTLSRFLRDYVYIPLGGNRKGKARRYVNLMATMVLGGIWHGAGWTFILWGTLHGLYLVINHGWRSLAGRAGIRMPALAGGVLTFGAVVVGWVFFRAADVPSALNMLGGMFGLNGFRLPVTAGQILSAIGLDGVAGWFSYFSPNNRTAYYTGMIYTLIAAFIAFLMPNTVQLFRRFRPVTDDMTRVEMPVDLVRARSMAGRLRNFVSARAVSPAGAVVLGLCVATVLHILNSSHTSEFLYYQF